MKDLNCLCGHKGGAPIWKVCQGEAEHERKNIVNTAMARYIKHLPDLAKLLGNNGEISIAR